MWYRPSAVLISMLLAACGSSAPLGGSADPAPAQGLCVSSDCAEILRLVTIPDAENLLFLDDGRLIVSGGRNVYVVSGSLDAGFLATPISAQDCGFTGLALQYGHLYAVCGDSKLYATPIAETLALQPIFDFSDACIPNGAAFGTDGNLYVVDEPLNPACGQELPKIMKLTIAAASPMTVVSQQTWVAGSPAGGLAFGTDNVLKFPNGLTRLGNRFYGTDGGSVFYVDMLADGSPGPVTPIFFEGTAHDDLSVADGSLLVTDFFGGRILQMTLDGQLLQATAEASFESPSAVIQGQPPMFSDRDILVTEKGLLQDPDGPVGNVLTLMRTAAGIRK